MKLAILIALFLLLFGTPNISGTPSGQTNVRTAAGPPANSPTTVKINNFKFDPKVVTIPAGSTVKWVNEGGKHTVESATGVFKSPTLTQGQEFEFKFDKPGSYPFHCGFHGDVGGKDMAGTVVATRKR